MSDIIRCPWCASSAEMQRYHDTEWGTPLHGDRELFEFLILDGFQAGLSWSCILNKRAAFRKAFDGFDAEKISNYSDEKISSLMADAGIVRNRLKIAASITNARSFLEVQSRCGSFDSFIWQFTDGTTLKNSWTVLSQIPVSTKESDAMSKELKRLGFKFVGSTICYAFMQAAGIVNDHLTSCFRYSEV